MATSPNPFDQFDSSNGGNPFDQFDSAKPTSTDMPAKKPFSMKDYLLAAPETAASLVSGTASTIGGGLAGLADAPLYAAGLSKTQPADLIRSIQQAGTYQPRTQGGQALSGVASYLPGKLAQGANWAGEGTAALTGSPALGAAVNTGIQALPMALGSQFLKPGAAVAASPEVAAAQALKLKLTPEQAQSGFLGRATQSLAGSAKLERSLSRQNAPQINAAAAQEIGAADLTKPSIAAVKAPANAVYKQVASVGNVPVDAQFKTDIANISNPGGGSFSFDVPKSINDLKTGYGGVGNFDSADAIAKIRQLRADSSSNIKAPMAPEQNALGYAQQQVAKAIEGQLDRHIQANAGANGIAPDLMDQYQQARVQLAKVHTIEKSMDGPNLSAQKLAKQQDRGAPLSGNLQGIANAYQNFDRALQPISKLRNSGPFSVLDGVLGAAAGPARFAVDAATLVRPIARSILGSNLYQKVGIGGAPAIRGLLSDPSIGLAGKLLPAAQPQPQGLLQ